MQFNRDVSGKLTPLPKPSIDTGLGLERMVAIVQNVPTNYDIDLIRPIMNKVEDLSEKRIGESRESDVAMKVIADHSRAAAFLIGDGVLPANEGRGYVLRRIMRRAIRYGRNIGLARPFLHKTAAKVFDIMKPAYPELSDAASFITNVIENEEIRFSETLDNGLKLLNNSLSELKAKGLTQVPGQLIFKLYDTYGFPVDIVRDVIRDEEMELDLEGFDQAMEAQRERSKSIATFDAIGDAYKNLSAHGIIPEFVGHDKISCDSKVLVLVKDGEEAQEVTQGQTVEVVTEVTPFYGESGGQIGDTGKIVGDNLNMEISNTIKDPTGIIIHKGKIISGNIKKGDTVTLTVDRSQRNATACNHTATHILHFALRKVLGDHVKQAGSLVAPDKLRFDFTHFSQPDSETLDKIETLVNQRIRENIPVRIAEMDADEAFKTGATALFEEKYGDRVRVVALNDFSKELCGGTHTDLTGNIGLFKIIGESSVASGIRRIEALTGVAAVTYVQRYSKLMHDAAMLLREQPEAVPRRIEKLLSFQKSLEKEVEKLKARIAMQSADWTEKEVKTIHGVKVLVKKVSVDKPAAMRDLADRFKEKIKSGIVILGSSDGSKALLIVVVTKDLTGRYHAGKIVNGIGSIVGGGGGGRPDMAQAGGSKPEKLEAALEKAYEVVESSY
jgi:alanyl-tRNA synthetase